VWWFDSDGTGLDMVAAALFVLVLFPTMTETMAVDVFPTR
jgi:hypothetical protein